MKILNRLVLAITAITAFALLCSCGGSDDSASNETKTSNHTANTPSTTQSSDSDGIQWRDWDEGMQEVVGTQKFAIVYFDTTDCAPCMWMEDSLWSDPGIIAAVKKDFVPIKVRTHRNKIISYQGQEFTESHLSKIFLLPGYPMTLFLSGEKNEFIGGQPSIIHPRRMHYLMEYTTSKAYEDFTFDEYLQDLGVSLD